MNKDLLENIDYLSDEELDNLILEIEEHEIIEAPPNLSDEILQSVFGNNELDAGGNTEVINISNRKDKKRAYIIYSLKVAISVAAAIALMFVMPTIQDKSTVTKSKEEMLASEQVLSKDEVLNRNSSVSKLGQSNVISEKLNFDIFE